MRRDHCFAPTCVTSRPNCVFYITAEELLVPARVRRTATNPPWSRRWTKWVLLPKAASPNSGLSAKSAGHEGSRVATRLCAAV